MAPRGRPRVGEPINIRLPDELLAAVDHYAEAQDISRAEGVRRLLTVVLYGSNRAAVRLLTGFTDAELDDLGGFTEDLA